MSKQGDLSQLPYEVKNKVYQRFDLDRAEMDELLKNGKLNPKDILNSAIALREAILRKGYDVLESQNTTSGLPESFIIGTELGEVGNIKRDFGYEVAKLSLPYTSAPLYIMLLPKK